MTPLVSVAQMSPHSAASSSIVPSLTTSPSALTHAHLAAMYANSGPYSEQHYSLSALGVDQSAFYNPAATAGLELKESLSGSPVTTGWPYPPPVYYGSAYEAPLTYPFAGYGMGIDAARRKNATREATQTLKTWLTEHKKNPYPTKGEKLMLAIITKMTLTQVSTWFANARRRLKKENKMTWEPRSRTDDDEDEEDDKDDEKIDDKERKTERINNIGLFPNYGKDKKEIDDISVSDDVTNRDEGDIQNPPTDTVNTKPRIWSLAAMATSGINGSGSASLPESSAGKIPASGLFRGLHQLEATPYKRPLFSFMPSINVSDAHINYAYGNSMSCPPFIDMSHGLLGPPLTARNNTWRLDQFPALRLKPHRLDKE